MGELHLRWAMKLPVAAPLAWPPFASPSMERIKAVLLAMDDVRDRPRPDVMAGGAGGTEREISNQQATPSSRS